MRTKVFVKWLVPAVFSWFFLVQNHAVGNNATAGNVAGPVIIGNFSCLAYCNYTRDTMLHDPAFSDYYNRLGYGMITATICYQNPVTTPVR